MSFVTASLPTFSSPAYFRNHRSSGLKQSSMSFVTVVLSTFNRPVIVQE